MKGLPYETIMALAVSELSDLYPHGALEKKGRWLPAKPGEATKTLRQLLRDKKARRHQSRLLHKDSTRGYTEDPGMSMRPDAGEAVDEATQKRFSEEAEARFASHQPALSERVKALEEKIRPEAWNSLRTRVERLERAANKEAA